MEETSTTPAIAPERELTVGTVVGYVLPDGNNKGQTRPAIVLRVWSNKCCNLSVFTDGRNDYPVEGSTFWATSRMYDDGKELGTWHYIK